MKDVALQAGVSQSTDVVCVERPRGHADQPRKPAKRVMQAVEELGYRPRGAGRPPKTAGAGVIGLIFDEVATSPFAAISIEGVQEAAWKANVIVEVVMTGGDPDYESEVLKKWSGDNAIGVIYGSILTRELRAPDGLGRHRTVLLNCNDADRRYASVVPAERRGGEVATAALIAEGHQRIAFISGEPWMEASRSADGRL